jgi:hypothetical protein
MPHSLLAEKNRGDGRLLAASLALTAIVGCFALGWNTLLSSGVALPAILAACIAALSCRHIVDAGASAFGGVALGMVCAAVSARLAWGGVATWAPVLVEIAVAAGVGAVLARFVLDRAPGLRRILGLLALLAIVGAMWASAMAYAAAPVAKDLTWSQALASEQPIVSGSSDDVLYLDVVQRMHRGESYYPAFLAVFAEANRVRPGADDLRRPTNFRVPTLYWILSRLPNDGLSIVLALLTAGTVAAFSAYGLARRFVAAPLALVPAAGVATLYSLYTRSPIVMGSEAWAGAFGVLSVALFVAAVQESPAGYLKMVLAAAAALLAAAFRELAAPFLLLGLVACVVDADSRLRRLWIPWAAGAVIWALGYAAHMSAARAVVDAAHYVQGAVDSTWFHPDGSGLLGALYRYTFSVGAKPVLGVLVFALAAVGSLVAGRDMRVRLVLGGCVVGAGTILCFFHSPGTTGLAGVAPAYWADIVLPTVLACAPLAFVLLGPPFTAKADEPPR